MFFAFQNQADGTGSPWRPGIWRGAVIPVPGLWHLKTGAYSKNHSTARLGTAPGCIIVRPHGVPF
jgi:hypothetical protein